MSPGTAPTPGSGGAALPEKFYSDESVTLYHGDYRDVLPSLGAFDLIIADPPYGETSLDWDRWPDGWPAQLAAHSRAMWCFGSMRMFLDRRAEFEPWTLSQDIVWEKHNGANFATDRFSRVHEFSLHWYQGAWADVHHVTPTTAMAVKRTVRRKPRPPHWTGALGASSYQSEDGGPLLMTSVIYARSMHGRAINETEKPTEVLEPLISYACPPGGTVLDPFSGSASTGIAARALGRKAVLIEKREQQCEASALRLAQGALDFGEASA